jgi:hypothetical protein
MSSQSFSASCTLTAMGSQRLSWKGVAKLQTDICTRLTDDDIKVIVAAGLENLEELKLMECPGITVSALHTLAATSLPKLRRECGRLQAHLSEDC